jgi:hypothetical protein
MLNINDNIAINTPQVDENKIDKNALDNHLTTIKSTRDNDENILKKKMEREQIHAVIKNKNN